MKLYSAWYCPFAQRAWMTLLLKGIEFEYIEVDPFRESTWWLNISRNSSQVPVIVAPNLIQAGETTVIDSTRIVEYLDHLQPETQPLLPHDPNQRAEHRYWMEHVNNQIVPYMYQLLMAQETKQQQAEAEGLLQGLEQLLPAMADEGPFFIGSQLTAVDVLLAPFAYRIDALLGHYRQFVLPQNEEHWSRYQQWYQAVVQHTCFKATGPGQTEYRQKLIEFYLPYSLGKR